ncbi:hypothetical protein F5884DRAFT_540087 [Xylogone sp. PMI_703]|nr:hypothetical protein F5884DRAFT_540087 [Xylogone sp. PMI_703]
MLKIRSRSDHSTNRFGEANGRTRILARTHWSSFYKTRSHCVGARPSLELVRHLNRLAAISNCEQSAQQLDGRNEEFSRTTSTEIQVMKDVIEKFGTWGKGILGALLVDINQGSTKTNAQRGSVPDRVTSQPANNYHQRPEPPHPGHPKSFNELGPQNSNTFEQGLNDYNNMDQFFTDDR